MGLFGFGKKKSPTYTYKMLFSSPFNYERDHQIKSLALKRLNDAGVVVSNTKTTVMGPGAKSEVTGEPGEAILITNDAIDDRTSFMTIEVKTNEASAEAINAAFADIKSILIDADIFFQEF